VVDADNAGLLGFSTRNESKSTGIGGDLSFSMKVSTARRHSVADRPRASNRFRGRPRLISKVSVV
jgi:hypothetical protein